MAIDAAGHIYVTDGYNNRVRKLDADGNFLGSWGGVGAGNGQFRYPYGIAIDSSGNIYVAEYTGHRIQKFDAGMNYLAQWPVDPAGVEVGSMLAVDETDRGYVSTDSSHKIRKYSSSGERLAVWGGSASSNDGLFNNPVGLAADRAGCLYVADRLNHRIQKLTTDGVFVAKMPACLPVGTDAACFSKLPRVSSARIPSPTRWTTALADQPAARCW